MEHGGHLDHGGRVEHGGHLDHDRHPARGGDRAVHDKHEGHTPEMFRNRFFVTLAVTVPILYFSEQLQQWFGYEAISFAGSSWVNPVLATVVYFYGGVVFLRGAAYELSVRAPGMMTLISIAITVAYGYSLAVSFGLPGEPFYWELATLLDVMLLGHWMEMKSVQSAGKALEHLTAMMPPIAHREADGRLEDVPVEQLRDGDVIVVRPGEQVPADGEIVEGATSMNEAFLTGESRPVPKGVGDEAIGGAVNGEGAVRVQITRTGEATTLSQIVRLVEEAQASRSRFQVLADRAALWLTLVAIGVSVPTFAAWLVLDGLTPAITRAVTVLVIACPHALGLAIPLVTVNATTLSAGNGILVRSREAFERARDVRIVAFDKTGTLTEGRFAVSNLATTPGVGEHEALGIAAGLEALSEHPLAAAITSHAETIAAPRMEVTDTSAVAGQGLQGMVEGRRYRIGRPEWAEELGVTLSQPLQEALAKSEERGESAVVLMDDDRALAVVALADQVRESARRAVDRLRQLGVTPVMITGDAEAVARTVAADLGMERIHARVLPQDKAAIVRNLRAEGRTAFVGDGINDAPALLEADLGVAIGAGTNVAIESADLVLVDDDPEDIVRALELAGHTRRKMVQNLAWATGYNAVALPLAAGVAAAWGLVLSPAIGALFMSLSTVIVAVNAMLLRRTRLD